MAKNKELILENQLSEPWFSIWTTAIQCGKQTNIKLLPV